MDSVASSFVAAMSSVFPSFSICFLNRYKISKSVHFEKARAHARSLRTAYFRIEIEPIRMSILLKGGKVVNADSSVFADVLIRDGLIEEVGTNIAFDESVTVIDVTNKLVVPGTIYFQKLNE